MRSIDANTWYSHSVPTSVKAMEKAWGRTGSQRRLIFEAVKASGSYGMTDYELEDYLKLDGNSVRPGRKSLERDGWLIDSGKTRPNKNGNHCIVWITKEQEQLF